MADVRDHLAVESVVEETVRRLGGLDILVNNAGVGWFGTVESESHEDWRRVIDTNLTGIFNCCHAAIPHMRRRGESYIINISSLAGKNVVAGRRRLLRVEGGRQRVQRSAAAGSAAGRHSRELHLSRVGEHGLHGARRPGNDWKLRPEDVAQVVIDLVRTRQAQPGEPGRDAAGEAAQEVTAPDVLTK